MVFERGSITGIRVRGLEPKEALLDTVGGPGLEPTGPLELKRLLAVEDSPCPPALDDLREPVVELFLRFCSAIPEPTSRGNSRRSRSFSESTRKSVWNRKVCDRLRRRCLALACFYSSLITAPVIACPWFWAAFHAISFPVFGVAVVVEMKAKDFSWGTRWPPFPWGFGDS